MKVHQNSGTERSNITITGGNKRKVKDSSCCSCTSVVAGTLAVVTALTAAAYNWKNQIAEKLPGNLAETFLNKMNLVGQFPGMLREGMDDMTSGNAGTENAKVVIGTGLTLAILIGCVVGKYISGPTPRQKIH